MNNSLVKNSLYNILYKVISVLYPLVTVTYVSHILMSERMGMVNYAQNIVSYFAIVAALGIPTYGIRETSIRRSNKEELSNNFWELFTINAISTTISLVVYIVLIIFVDRFRGLLILYIVAGIQIVFNYLNVDWFYQGIEEYKYISIRSIVVKLIALIVLPILVRTSKDYINYALIYCLAIGGNNVFNIIRIRKYIKKPSQKLELAKHMKPISILLVVSIAVEIYAMIDTTMIGVFCDDSTVGCYSNAMKLTRMVTTSAAAIGAVLFPRLSLVFLNNDQAHFNELINTGIKIMLMFAIPAAVGLILLREDIILILFGDSFIGAIPILSILSIMIPIVVCNTLLGGQVLVTLGRENKYMISVVLASIVNVVLNSLFIPRFGAPSAAFASLISESIVLLCYYLFTKDYVRLHIGEKYFLSILIPIAIYVIVSVFFISRFQMNRILRLIINIVACGIIYFGGGILLKNEAMLFSLKKLKGLVENKRTM